MKRAIRIICMVCTVFLVFAVSAAGLAKSDAAMGSASKNLDKVVVMAAGSPVAMVKGKVRNIEAGNLKVRPQYRNGSLFVPVRFIAGSFGGKATWETASGTAVLHVGNSVIRLKSGSDSITVDGKAIRLKAPAMTENGRIYADAVQIAGIMGYKVYVNNGLVLMAEKSGFLDGLKYKNTLDGLKMTLNQPPAVGSRNVLKGLLQQVSTDTAHYRNTGLLDMKVKGGVAPALQAATENSTAAASKTAADSAGSNPGADSNPGSSGDYSTTNVQVEGVDEGDIVKTDGKYIYQVNRNRIAVVRAVPAGEMKLESLLVLPDGNQNPVELYVEGDRLMVIVTAYTQGTYMIKNSTVSSKTRSLYPYYMQQTTKALVYDISDRSNIKKIREVEVEGQYVSSRKIGSKLYLVANRNISNIYYDGWEKSAELRPYYMDTVAGSQKNYVDYSRIYCFPESIEPSYLMVAALDIGDDASKAEIYSCLGAGENIYVSQDYLYVAFTDYENSEFTGGKNLPAGGRDAGTVVYKFSLEKGKTTFLCKGTVRGTVLNQFSMDEYAGCLRIATTSGDVWRTDEGISKNNVYILDESLALSGSLEDLAPGEKIYSVRFMGERGYIVTFKTVDPLFVIDLKDRKSPKVLGALKIPGYSDYLHPYDSTHLIGFGKDTVEVKGGAYYQGMKLAMFDVSDVTKPVQMFTESIGGRGTDSELLRNHKALLFSKAKNLLAFLVTVMEVPGDAAVKAAESLQYGSFTFQGAYIYNVDLVKGFTLKGRITHISPEEYLKAGDGWYDSGKNVERILYIGDTLYTLSQARVMANDLAELKEKGEVAIP